jgi:uncharacterized C2H2 Zn-finger protein
MPYVEYDEVEAICSDCGRIFRSEEALVSHREESHSGRDERPARADTSAEQSCPVCHQRFDSGLTLRTHVAKAHPRG